MVHTDMHDQGDYLEPESSSSGDSSEEDETLFNDGSIHSIDLDFVEVNSDEGVSH